MRIDADLVGRLIADQHPQWAGLPVRPVEPQGWDNRTFRLGDALLVRLPSADWYSAQVEKEHRWLPVLAAGLPLPIPEPVALGRPSADFPRPWSVRRWLEGESALAATVPDGVSMARALGAFLAALHRRDTEGGPPAGAHSFHRGGHLAVYDAEVLAALDTLGPRVDAAAARTVWARARQAVWAGPDVWVHGDVAPGNLLISQGRLAAVIDFGCCAVGDPACDLVIAWTFLEGPSREAFRDALTLNEGAWARARGWALWKALIQLAAGGRDAEGARRTLEAVLAEFSPRPGPATRPR